MLGRKILATAQILISGVQCLLISLVNYFILEAVLSL